MLYRIWIKRNVWLIVLTVIVFVFCGLLLTKGNWATARANHRAFGTVKKVRKSGKHDKRINHVKNELSDNSVLSGSTGSSNNAISPKTSITLNGLTSAQMYALILVGGSDGTGDNTALKTIAFPTDGISTSTPIDVTPTVDTGSGDNSLYSNPGDGTFVNFTLESLGYGSFQGYTRSGDTIYYYFGGGSVPTEDKNIATSTVSLKALFQKYYLDDGGRKVNDIAARIRIQATTYMNSDETKAALDSVLSSSSDSSSDNEDSDNNQDNSDYDTNQDSSDDDTNQDDSNDNSVDTNDDDTDTDN